MNDALLFSGLITFSVIVGFVALKFFPKNPLIKAKAKIIEDTIKSLEK